MNVASCLHFKSVRQDLNLRPHGPKQEDSRGGSSALSNDQCSVLEKLRETIKAAAPNAEVCVSYRLTDFR
jgi:hypothetical protein